jgi:hypothetical protein
LCVVIRDNGGFEGAVIFGIFQRTDDGFSRESVPNCVATGIFLACLRDGASAFAGVISGLLATA